MGSREAPAADEWCAGRVTRLIHGTTVATNAILEHKGAIIGLLGTEGSEDVLEIGCQRCCRMCDLNMEAETPVFLAPRRRRVGIGKRLHRNGEVLGPRNEAQVIEAVHTMKACDAIPAVAVCYLFSCKNPGHERRTRELVRGTFPELPVSLSYEVDATDCEYSRTGLEPIPIGYLSGILWGKTSRS